MKYPRKFFDALGRRLDGQPCDLLLLLCFTLIAGMCFFAVLIFLWLLSKQIITLEDMYHFASVVFFGVAGWLAWREFSVSHRAEQIQQLDQLNNNLVGIWGEVYGDKLQKRVLDDLEMVQQSIYNSYGVSSQLLSRIGTEYSSNLRQEYFNHTEHLSSGIRAELDRFIKLQMDTAREMAKQVNLRLKEGYDALDSKSGQFVKNKINELQGEGKRALFYGTTDDPFQYKDRSWKILSNPESVFQSNQFNGLFDFVDDAMDYVAKEKNQITFYEMQYSYVCLLDDAIQRELERLVRSR